MPSSTIRYFLDTYAMVEYLKGNTKYQKFVDPSSPNNGQQKIEPVTSLMNLIELYYLVLRDHGEKTADNAFLAFRQFETPIKDEDIRTGMTLRLRERARKVDFSYADAIGYTISERLGSRYLTGDSALRGLPNVEFIK